MTGKTAYKSRFEAEYALWLDREQREGNILSWTYEALKLRVGPVGKNAWYTPDFLVETKAGLEVHETKGFKERAGMARFKAAAEMHPFKFVLVQQKKGAWESKEF